MRLSVSAFQPATQRYQVGSKVNDAHFSARRSDTSYRNRLNRGVGETYVGQVSFRRKVESSLPSGERQVLLADVTVKPLASDPAQVEIRYTQTAKYANKNGVRGKSLPLNPPLIIVGRPGGFKLSAGDFGKHSLEDLAKSLLKAALNPPEDPAMQGKNQPKKPKPQVGAPKASGAPKKPSGGGYSGGSGGIRSRSRRRGF